MAKSSALSSFNPDPLKGVDQPIFLGLVDRYADAMSALKFASSDRKDVLTSVDGKGISKKAFLRAVKDAELSGSEREREAFWYGHGMAFMGKPLSFYTAHGDIIPVSQSVPGLKKIDTEGHEAGIQGASKDSNPWTPGTEEHQRWNMAYLRGQGDRRSDPPAATRSRGRPRKDGSPAQARSAPALEVHEGGATGGETSGAHAPDTSETRH
jgi:hypothetical protein